MKNLLLSIILVCCFFVFLFIKKYFLLRKKFFNDFCTFIERLINNISYNNEKLTVFLNNEKEKDSNFLKGLYSSFLLFLEKSRNK